MEREWPEWTAPWVVTHGLPRLPGPILPGFAEAPVALWRGDRCAAVLFIYNDPDDLALPYSYDLEIVEQDSEGRWIEGSRHGGSWSGNLDYRPSGDLTGLTGHHGRAAPGDPRRMLWVTGGRVGPQVTSLEMTQEGRVTRVPVDASGWFLVGAVSPPRAVLKPVRQDGSYATRESRPVEWPLGPPGHAHP
jgi:hypothetical protein